MKLAADACQISRESSALRLIAVPQLVSKLLPRSGLVVSSLEGGFYRRELSLQLRS
jgi:hypothetical protein